MDELDETFLNKFNTDHTPLSEDDFEKIMYQFESITKDKLPHLHLVSLDILLTHINILIHTIGFSTYPRLQQLDGNGSRILISTFTSNPIT